MDRVTNELPAPLLAELAEGRPALLLTTGSDGFPASAYTWAVAVDARRVRFGADHGSSALANLQREDRASLQVATEGGMLFLLKGLAAQVKPKVEAARRLGVALWELRVVEARDQSWPGVHVRPLAYEWALELRDEMLALERAVYLEMRGEERLSGLVVTGRGRGASFTQVPWARERLAKLLGAEPCPGTLNLKVVTPEDVARWKSLRARPGLGLESPETGHCDARAYPARLGDLPVVIVVPEVPDYPAEQVEIVAAQHLRSRLALDDGAALVLVVPEQ